MISKNLLTLIPCLLISLSLSAQFITTEHYNVVNTIGPGVPDLRILNLSTDSDGDLMASTLMGGLGILRGDDWLTITTEDGLSRDEVQNGYQDVNGDYWILGHDKIFIKRNSEIIPIENEANRPRCIAPDQLGNIWIGCDGRGLWKYSSIGEWTQFTVDDGLVYNGVYDLVVDDDNHVWIATYQGVSVYDGVSFTNFTTENGLVHNTIWEIGKDDLNRIWMASWRDGINIFDGISWDTLDIDLCRDMYVDESDTLWITTNKVVYTFKDGVLEEAFSVSDFPFEGLTFTSFAKDRHGNKFTGLFYSGILAQYSNAGYERLVPDMGLLDNSVEHIAIDDENRMYFGGLRGLSILEAGVWINYTYKQPFDGDNVQDMYRDSRGHIWLSVVSEIYEFDGLDYTNWTEDEDFVNADFLCTFEDTEGNFWFGTNDGAYEWDRTNWTLYSMSDGMVANQVFDICQDGEGSIWLANEYGMNRLKNGVITAYPSGDNGLSPEDIREILASGSGDVWVATGNGLSRFDGAAWTTFTPANSQISHESIYSLAEDRYGNLWVGTSRRLNRFDGSEFTSFDVDDGLYYDRGLAELYFTPDSSSLWVGTLGKGTFHLDFTTSVQKYSYVQGLELSPNPAANYTTISFDDEMHGNYSLSLLNINGQLMHSQEGYLGDYEMLHLELNGVVPGVYVVRLNMDYKRYIQKLVVTK